MAADVMILIDPSGDVQSSIIINVTKTGRIAEIVKQTNLDDDDYYYNKYNTRWPAP